MGGANASRPTEVGQPVIGRELPPAEPKVASDPAGPGTGTATLATDTSGLASSTASVGSESIGIEPADYQVASPEVLLPYDEWLASDAATATAEGADGSHRSRGAIDRRQPPFLQARDPVGSGTIDQAEAAVLALLTGASNEPGPDFAHLTVTAWGLGGAPWDEVLAYDDERQRAYADALHHAWEEIAEVPLFGHLTVGDAMVDNRALIPRLRRVILAAERTFFEDDSRGLLRCRLRVPMAGAHSLRSALYLAALRPDQPEPANLLPSAASRAADLALQPTRSSPFKRVVLDARRLDLVPALFPRFYGEDGRLLFQEGLVFHRQRFTHPAVRYATDLRQALAGVPENRILLILPKPSTLTDTDLVIPHHEAAAFVGFARHLATDPLSPRELVIVIPERPTAAAGLLARTQPKKEGGGAPGAATKGGKGGKRGPRSRRGTSGAAGGTAPAPR